REAVIWAGLKHPHIVPFYGYDAKHGPVGALISPWYDNGSAMQYISSNDLIVGERRRLFREVCSGLHYLHDKGVIHGDLKPANILISDIRTALIGDFGVTMVLGARPESRLALAGVYSSPGYAAPELLQGSSVTKSSDIYALGGILLYFMMQEEPSASLYPPILPTTLLQLEGPYTPYKMIMMACWELDPLKRPLVESVEKGLEIISLHW
ncbi:kinase-like protein, partial [Serendipita vermifera]